MRTNQLALAVITLLLSACAVGPLVSHEPARTVGKGKVAFTGGRGAAGWVAKGNFGISEDLDMGVQWESLSLGLRLKYAFLNHQDGGFSMAAAAGTGLSLGGSHYYGDLMTSYLAGRWEPYGSVRIVHVKTDPIELRDKDTEQVDIVVDRLSYNYGQVFLGSRFWINETWYLSGEISSLFAVSSGVHFGDGLLWGAAAGARF